MDSYFSQKQWLEVKTYQFIKTFSVLLHKSLIDRLDSSQSLVKDFYQLFELQNFVQYSFYFPFKIILNAVLKRCKVHPKTCPYAQFYEVL